MSGAFDFGSLDPEKKKSPKEIMPLKPKEENKKEISLEQRRFHNYESSRVTNEKILEKLENLEKQLNKLIDTLNRTPSITKNSYNSLELTSNNQKSIPSEISIQDSNINETKNFETLESFVLKIPKIEECKPFDIAQLNWGDIFQMAKRFGWLLNIYTYTRFLEHLDILFGNTSKRQKLTTEWIRFKRKNEVLASFGLHWEQNSLLRLGKTQQDIIDAFAENGNKPQSSNEIFDYLSKQDPQHYDRNRKDNIDLRRVRNVLSQLNSLGFIETSRSVDNQILFNLKKT